jgi:hypothetical protein
MVLPPLLAILVQPTLAGIPLAVKLTKVLELATRYVLRHVYLIPVLGDAPILPSELLIPCCVYRRS